MFKSKNNKVIYKIVLKCYNLDGGFMNYLISNDGKYDVYLDRDKIIELRSFLMKKYAKRVTHYGIKSEIKPRELFRIRNEIYKDSEFSFNDIHNSYDDLFYYYDDYEYPPIIDLINEILRGNLGTIKKLISNSIRCNEEEQKIYYDKLKSFIKVVNKNDKNKLIIVPSENKFKTLVKRMFGKKVI